MVTSKDEVADIINYKILWEPESEPNADESPTPSRRN